MPKATTSTSVMARPKGKTVAASTSSSNSKSKSKSKSEIKLYSSFLPIPLLLPSPTPVPIASSSKSASSKGTNEVKHYIYVRRHKSTPTTNSKSKGRPQSVFTSTSTNVDEEQGSEQDERTLFAINLPADATERDLRTIFGRWGVVESIAFGGKEVDVLEQAVRGLPVEDDEDEDEDDEDEDEDEGEAVDGEGDESRQIGEGATFRPDIPTKLTKNQKRSARRRAKNTLPPSVPSIVPLPPLDPKPTLGVRVAHVTFLDPVSVERVMAPAGSVQPILLTSYTKSKGKSDSASASASEPTGLEYYTSLHSSLRPERASIKSYADSSMARFDHLHSLLLSSRAKAQGAGALVDEDGFTVVVRSGRYGRAGGRGDGLGGMGVGVAGRGFAKKEAERKKGRGAGELEGFYKFQKVDQKRQELADLRTKFESDKAKVEELKKARRYKPY